jgi:hypothetical protein
VLVHLCVDEPDKLTLVVLEHIPNIVFGGQVRLKVPDELACQLVQQHSMIVVADVVLVDQAADDVVLQSRLLDYSVSADDSESLVVRQPLDEQVLGHRRIMNAGAIEVEVLIADRYFARRNDGNARNVRWCFR